MNARVKKLWIKALRSGKYKQGRAALRSNGAFCCLGVLCDLHGKIFKKRWTRNGSENWAYAGDTATLPPVVMKWAGLDDDDPKLTRDKRAAMLNDSGKDFSYIADQIEARL